MTIQTIKLYKEKVEIKFYPDSHRYYVNGELKRGTTTILNIKDKSGALVPWAIGCFADYLRQQLGKKVTEELILEGSGQHRLRKEEAADYGSKIHGWVEAYINSKLTKAEAPDMPEDREVQIGVGAFLDWEKEHKVKFLSSERVLYSLKHDFVGKMDIEAMIDGKLCLVDLKATNGLYNSVYMQTAAYLMADKEESGRKYEGRWAVRLAKESEQDYRQRMIKKGREENNYQVFEARNLDLEAGNLKRDFAGFLACLELDKFERATNKWAKN